MTYKTHQVCEFLRHTPSTCRELSQALGFTITTTTSLIAHLSKYGCVQPAGAKRARWKIYEFIHMPAPMRQSSPRHMSFVQKRKPAVPMVGAKTPAHYQNIYSAPMAAKPHILGEFTAAERMSLCMLTR